MSTVILAARAHNSFQLEYVDRFLKFTLKGLKVETKVSEVTSRGWVQVAVSGEDEKIALKYLAEAVGLCPSSLEHVDRFSTFIGRVTALNKSKSELFVDVGVLSPETVDASVTLHCLQAQLLDGRKVALKKAVEFFGFCEGYPLTVKLISVDKEKNHVEAQIAERQLTLYASWMKSLLDRLIIIGSPISEVRMVLKKAGLNRDVVDVETLGLFEQAIVCKLGTDAAGLIPRIGKRLPSAALSVFSPKRLLEFLEHSTSFTS